MVIIIIITNIIIIVIVIIVVDVIIIIIIIIMMFVTLVTSIKSSLKFNVFVARRCCKRTKCSCYKPCKNCRCDRLQKFIFVLYSHIMTSFWQKLKSRMMNAFFVNQSLSHCYLHL